MSNNNEENKAKLILGNKELNLDVLNGSVGPSVLDIRKIYSELGCFTYDPGYGATGSCESKITYINGEEGVLLHRGYPIEELAKKSSFLEVAYYYLMENFLKKIKKLSLRMLLHFILWFTNKW